MGLPGFSPDPVGGAYRAPPYPSGFGGEGRGIRDGRTEEGDGER